MDTIGLDIGSQILKIVQLESGGGRFRLKAIGNGPSTYKGLISDADADLTSLAAAVKKLHSDLRIDCKNVVAAVPEDQAITRLISLPSLSAEELESALKWEAEQYVPFPLAEATLSYQTIHQQTRGANQKMEVLLVAALNRTIDKLVRVIKAAGLNPISLETEMLAMSRSLVVSDQEITLLVDLGAKFTDLAIVEKGQLVFTRSMPTAGEAVTRAIASDLGLEMMQAEEYKRAYGLTGNKLEGKVAKTIEPILEAIIKEIVQAIHFYQSSRRDKLVKRVVLSGGTSFLPEVVGWMADRIGVETQVGDPFTRVDTGNLAGKIPKETLPLYSVAAGLAMKEV